MLMCLNCLSVKPSDSFAKNQKWCKKCKADYYQANKIKFDRKSKVWALKNPEKSKQIKIKNYENNKAEYLTAAKSRYLLDKSPTINRAKKRYVEKKQLILNQAKIRYESLTPEQKKIKIEAAAQFDKQNPHKARARVALRRARLIRATPKWLTKSDLKAIQFIYLEAQLLTEKTGILHHVDHIVPLLGKSVCGLHIANNLQAITESENLKKSNSFKIESEVRV